MVKKTISILTVVLALCMLLSITASANSAEPPGLTVIVSNPPPGLTLSLRFPDGTDTAPVPLKAEKKAWETYYRFFYHSYPGNRSSLKGAVIIASYENESFQCGLPEGTLGTYNNLLTLDIGTQSIVSGQPAWRTPALVALRVLLTLLIEGFIFFLFGYKKRESWIIFLVINLITQGALNAFLTGPQIGTYWHFGYILGEVIVFVVETVAFARLLHELSRKRAALFALTANAASLILGGLLISYLPI